MNSQQLSNERRLISDRAMWRLRVSIRVLSAALIALLARTVIDGLTVAGGVAEALIVALFLASIALRRQGRRLDPAGMSRTSGEASEECTRYSPSLS